jgi:hypothetical protein
MGEVADVLRDVISGLEDLRLDYLVGGSFASSAWGNPRQTRDLDLVLRFHAHDVDSLVERFDTTFILSRSSIVEALESLEAYAGFQLLHAEELFKVDVFVYDGSAFSASEFARKQRVTLLPGIEAWCAASEDIVVRKLAWYELGNRVSDRQWNDIVQVIQVQGPNFDKAYVLKWASSLGLGDLAEEAFVEANPI